MKTIVFVLLCLLAFDVFAQQPKPILLEADGRLTKRCGATVRDPPLTLPPPIETTGLGLPKQLLGNCTEAILTADGKGGAVGYWCAQVDPEKARLRLFAVQWSMVTLPMILDFSSLLILPNKEQRIADMHRKYQSLNIRDMCDIWNPLVDRLNAIYPAPLPALKQWVAIGGSVFTSNGVNLTGLTGRRVAAGVACSATVPPIISGAKVYYPLASAASSTDRIECRQATP